MHHFCERGREDEKMKYLLENVGLFKET